MPRLLFAAALMLATPVTAQAPGAIGPIEWSLRDRSSDGTVQLHLRQRTPRNNHNWSNSFRLAELQGLGSAQLAGRASTAVRFALVREPGRLDCAGQAGNNRGQGSCGFSADPAFSALLAARGIGRPSAKQSYHLALSGVGRAHLDALARHNYPRPTVSDLVAMGIHGATPQFIDQLAATGYRLRSVGDLVTFRIHRVDAAYIRAIAAQSPQLRNLSGDDLVAFRIHNVTPELVGTYARLGYRNLDPDDMVAMSIHRVTPEYIRALHALGYRDLPADQLVQMRIHGVTPQFIRSLQREGMALPSPETLVQWKVTGGPRHR